MMREIHLNKDNVQIKFDTQEETEQFQKLFEAYNHKVHVGNIQENTFTITDKETKDGKFRPLLIFTHHVLRNYHPWEIETSWDYDHKEDGSHCTKDLTRLRLKDKEQLAEIEVLGDHRSPNGLCYNSAHFYGRNIEYWKYWDKNIFQLTTNYQSHINEEEMQTFEFKEGETEIIIKIHNLT